MCEVLRPQLGKPLAETATIGKGTTEHTEHAERHHFYLNDFRRHFFLRV